MWRDVNIFNEVGIPAATFGFPRKTAPGLNEKFVDRLREDVRSGGA